MTMEVLPNRADALRSIEAELWELRRRGLAKDGHTVQIGQTSVQFTKKRTRMSFTIRDGRKSVLRGAFIKRTQGPKVAFGTYMHRGEWEKSFGVLFDRYSALSQGPLPEEFAAAVRRSVFYYNWCEDTLARARDAIGPLGGCLDDLVQRKSGCENAIDLAFAGSSPAFVMATAIVLWRAGARSCDIRALIQLVQNAGGNVDSLVEPFFEDSQSRLEFETFLKCDPEPLTAQVLFDIGQSANAHKPKGRLACVDWEVADLLSMAIKEAGFRLVPLT